MAVEHLLFQNLCKHVIVDKFKTDRLHAEPKDTVLRCFAVGKHFLQGGFL
ncbi:MAG: hypothetical protein ACOX7M_03955 [Dysosmobacter sp.]